MQSWKIVGWGSETSRKRDTLFFRLLPSKKNKSHFIDLLKVLKDGVAVEEEGLIAEMVNYSIEPGRLKYIPGSKAIACGTLEQKRQFQK
jgi:hypothetical protein